MKIWGLPSNEKSTVTFFQDNNILAKIPVWVWSQSEVYFGKKIFCKSNVVMPNKSKYSCLELVYR